MILVGRIVWRGWNTTRTSVNLFPLQYTKVVFCLLFQFKDLMNKIDKDEDDVDEDGNPIPQVSLTYFSYRVIS